MKRFIKKIIFYIIFCIVFMVVPSVVVDPYNVFHWKNARMCGIELNCNYIKTKYVLANPDKFSGFILGSSRVGAIHVENIESQKLYNMTYSAGTPADNLESLKTFIDEGIEIDMIMLGVDNLSYTLSSQKDHIRASYQYLKNNKDEFIKLYINPRMIINSMEIIKNNKIEKLGDYYYDYGWWWWSEYDWETNYDWNNPKPSLGYCNRMDEALEEIKEFCELCKENDIELIVFVNPMHKITYDAAVEQKDFLSFLERLAEVTPYYNFSGINDVTINNDNFIDTSHYNAYVGDMLIDVMFNGKVYEDLYDDGFGWYITKDNVEEFIELIK